MLPFSSQEPDGFKENHEGNEGTTTRKGPEMCHEPRV